MQIKSLFDAEIFVCSPEAGPEDLAALERRRESNRSIRKPIDRMIISTIFPQRLVTSHRKARNSKTRNEEDEENITIGDIYLNCHAKWERT